VPGATRPGRGERRYRNMNGSLVSSLIKPNRGLRSATWRITRASSMWPHAKPKPVSPNLRLFSDHYQPETRIDSPDISGIARNDNLPRPSSADHHVSVDNISRCGLRQQKANGSCVGSIKRNHVRGHLPDQPGKPCLSGRVPNRLSQCGSRNGHTHAEVRCARQKGDHSAIVPIERDQAARVEGDSAHAALFRPVLLLPELFFFPGRWSSGGCRRPSAQARSSFVSAPPVCCSASCSIVCHPAASNRAMPTACWTNADTLDAFPTATNSRIA